MSEQNTEDKSKKSFLDEINMILNESKDKEDDEERPQPTPAANELSRLLDTTNAPDPKKLSTSPIRGLPKGIRPAEGRASSHGSVRPVMASSQQDLAKTGFISPPSNTIGNALSASSYRRLSSLTNSYKPFDGVDPEKHYISENLKKKVMSILKNPKIRQEIEKMKNEVRGE
jgi:hypothetical protein